MATTIFIKFCGFIVHSKHNNMTLFPEKSLKLEKYILNFFLFPIVGPKPTHQSRSKWISRILLQLSRSLTFSFRPNPKIKGSSHKKKIKKFDFLKNGSNDFD